MWSAGVIFYILLVGKHPFRSGNREAIIQKVKNFKLDFEGTLLYMLGP